MAPDNLQPLLWSAAPIGLALVLAMLSEQVSVDQSGIQVGHRTGVAGCCVELVAALGRGQRLVPVGAARRLRLLHRTMGPATDSSSAPGTFDRFYRLFSNKQVLTLIDWSTDTSLDLSCC